MKTSLIIAGIVLIIAGFFMFCHVQYKRMNNAYSDVSLTGAGDNEDYAHKLARYRNGAQDAARTACTNYVVGIKSIIRLQADTTDDNFKKWTASAIVDYINHVGGVDRTNLELRFDPGFTGQPEWFKK